MLLEFENKYSEDELIEMVKSECEEVYNNNYFDNSVMDSVASFDDFKKSYIGKDYTEKTFYQLFLVTEV